MSDTPTFREGDRVRFLRGVSMMTGTVVEDRGPIGYKGRRLYMIRFSPDEQFEEMSQVELPAEYLELVSHGDGGRAAG